MPTEPRQTKLVNIDTIRGGDCIIVDGQEKTVSPKDIRYGGFCGTTIFGDSYKMGPQMVEKVIFKQFYRGKEIK